MTTGMFCSRLAQTEGDLMWLVLAADDGGVGGWQIQHVFTPNLLPPPSNPLLMRAALIHFLLAQVEEDNLVPYYGPLHSFSKPRSEE